MKRLTLALALIAITTIAIGCTNKPDGNADKNTGSPTPKSDNHDHDHKAPHGGHLIDLGHGHKYHAELVDDHETETITIYILDGELKPLSINQESISMILTAGDKTETFEIAAIDKENSSEFKSNDEKMMAMFEVEGVTGVIRATIDEKPVKGSFSHEAHGHEGGEHAGHKH